MITPWDLLPFALIGLFVWFWMDSLKTREIALAAARKACERVGHQFLDETVATERTRPARNAEGQLCLRRVYRFEYSDTGDNRHRGAVVMLGRAVDVVQIAGMLELVTSSPTRSRLH
ncbi:DUF3301 domain-containing protein [Nitrogeniibacter mangrovi]|uniref:DUF3301 domain-containing protein n=1 Tax=Nitrogeniibacter mangrovi TaxID=2016596 RepID=A0A6C1B6H8_9RHOO|nr:DUF3301 domain-containing protein [Nitrogeniibacter mangrovi]QID17890.1 DUF3301 domain-containing protein [Nitrogeniibacter mangrovi]